MWFAQAFTELSLWTKSLIALIGTGITAFFYKKLKIIFMAAFDKGKTLFNLDLRTQKMEEKAIETDEKISKIKDTTDEILYQLKTNNGTSLRDSINRIEEKVKHLRERLTYQIEWVGRLWRGTLFGLMLKVRLLTYLRSYLMCLDVVKSNS